jgi:hypothetical protein
MRQVKKVSPQTKPRKRRGTQIDETKVRAPSTRPAGRVRRAKVSPAAPPRWDDQAP